MRHLTTLTAFLASFLLVGTGVALACGNSYRYEMKMNVNNVVNAEGLLDKGMYKKAAKAAVLTFGVDGKKVHAFSPRSKGEHIRATRVVAVATVRLDGRIKLDELHPRNRAPRSRSAKSAKSPKVTPTIRMKRLEWAASQLKVLHEARPANAEMFARYAEAVTKMGWPKTGADVLVGLEKLAAKDMMPDAMSWATLASLRARNGDDAESAAALESCKKQARDAKMCVLLEAQGQS